VIGAAIHFDWQDSHCTTFYRLRVKRHSKHGDIVIKENHLPESQADENIVPARDDIYYWRVRACNALGCSKWSPYSKFRYVPQESWQRDDWMLPTQITIALR
jgi:hypothetical protein